MARGAARDVADEPFAAGEIRRLEELHLTAAERAIDGDLAAGRHLEVLAELEVLVARDPLREGLQAQRMLALYRSGRQAQALQAYRQARSALVEQIGVEPGPALRELHDAILRQDPQLDPPAVESEPLPAELYAGTALAGREAELDVLREAWRDAHARGGRFVLVLGARGRGKTRLAAEVAGEVHRDRAIVLHASGAGDPDAARAAISRAARARRPTLLVVDDVDRAGEEVGAALRELAEGLDALPVLVLATAQAGDAPIAPRVDATIALGPLGPDDVAAVTRLYADPDPREDVEVPIAGLVQDSGGVPRQVHQAAIEWARAERVRRLGGAAGRTASRRAGLRAAEDELAGDVVVALEAARERAQVPTDVVVCPFKGLAAFEPEDASFFFGRERLVAEMVARLAGAPMLGLVGPSAAGSRRCYAPGCCPHCARASCQAARPGRSRCCARASIRCARCTTRLPRRLRRAGSCSPSTSSRRPSWLAATSASARRSWTRWCDRRATRAGGRSCSWASARTSTAAVRPIRSSGGCSAPIRRPSGRCAATSCAARSSAGA